MHGDVMHGDVRMQGDVPGARVWGMPRCLPPKDGPYHVAPTDLQPSIPRPPPTPAPLHPPPPSIPRPPPSPAPLPPVFPSIPRTRPLPPPPAVLASTPPAANQDSRPPPSPGGVLTGGDGRGWTCINSRPPFLVLPVATVDVRTREAIAPSPAANSRPPFLVLPANTSINSWPPAVLAANTPPAGCGADQCLTNCRRFYRFSSCVSPTRRRQAAAQRARQLGGLVAPSRPQGPSRVPPHVPGPKTLCRSPLFLIRIQDFTSMFLTREFSVRTQAEGLVSIVAVAGWGSSGWRSERGRAFAGVWGGRWGEQGAVLVQEARIQVRPGGRVRGGREGGREGGRGRGE